MHCSAIRQTDPASAERSFCWYFAVCAAAIAILGCIQTSKAETKEFVAFSMRAAQIRLENAARHSEDYRSVERNLYELGGITKPWAIVLDKESNDIILVGERVLNSPTLTLDDWVVALRSRFLHTDQDPGVTIGPESADFLPKDAESFRHATTQKVQFLSGVENTRFGQVCYQADWFLKRVGLGYADARVENIPAFIDLSFQGATTPSYIPVRFWFYPVINKVNVLGDVIVLEKFRMGVSTQVLYAEVEGEPVGDLEHFEDRSSQAFARSFTENFSAAAKSNEAVATLEGLTRLAGLAKGISQVQTTSELSFWLQQYSVASAETPVDVPILERTSRSDSTGLTLICRGGVKMAALVAQMSGGDAHALKQLVLLTRQTADRITWGFTIQMIAGQPSVVTLPLDQSLYLLGGITRPWAVAMDKEGIRRLIDIATPPYGADAAHMIANGKIGNANPPLTAQTVSGSQSYSDASLKVGFEYPKGWQLLNPKDLAKRSATLLTAVNPDASDPEFDQLTLINSDDYQQNVNIRLFGIDVPFPLFFNMAQQSVGESLRQVHADGEAWTRKTVNGLPALEYTGKVTRLDMQLRYKGHIILQRDRAILIECVAEENQFQGVDEHYFQPILRTLHIGSGQ